MKKHSLATAYTALAVAAALQFSTEAANQHRFGLPFVVNDGEDDDIKDLQERMLDLQQKATTIKARAKAEKRDLTDAENDDIANAMAEFEKAETQIERLEQVAAMEDRMAQPQRAKTQPGGQQAAAEPEPAPRARTQPQRRNSVPAEPRRNDFRRSGFENFGEFLKAVKAGSSQGATPDPRLFLNAAPNTYGQESVGADGGFAVPPDFREGIVKKVMGEDSLLSLTDQLTTSSNAITVPTDETTPWQTSGGIQAYWEGEAGLKTQSKPALTEKTVKASKIICLVPLTDELVQDAPSMVSYVNSKAPEKIDSRVNEAIINGTGVGMPLGFLRSNALVTVTPESGQVADTLVFNNIVKMYTRMPAASRRRAVWLINADAETQMLTMQFPGTGTAVPAYLPPGGLSATPYGTLLGRPVIPVEAASALGDVGDISFVDLSQYMTVTRGGLQQDVSIHLWFDYDLTAFRFVLRIGGQPWWNAPITRLNGLSRSPFVALGAR